MLLLMLKQIRLKVKHVICCSPIAVENKIPNVSNLIKKKQIIKQKLVKLKIKLPLIMIMINILLLHSLIS